MKRHGIFRKVFLYTLIFLIATLCVAAVLFSQQFKSFYDNSQMQYLRDTFQPLSNNLVGKSVADIIKAVDNFYQKNQSFVFSIETPDGKAIYTTPGYRSDQQGYTLIVALPQNLILRATNIQASPNLWGDLTQKVLFALSVMLIIAVVGALAFAKWMTTPIHRLAIETQKMAALEVVPEPDDHSHDEIGQLAIDVHAMYEKLKTAISELENEVDREREMEENQRYFFSAASHELKTPIAATKALIEGMIAGVGDYKDHAKYLRECLKMLDSQDRIISEILDIVNLSGQKVQPAWEKINLAALMAGITQEYFAIAESSGQTLTIDIPNYIFCIADRDLLGRAISNVLMNALQNAPEGGFVRVWIENHAGATRLCILNGNSHIDEDVRPKLFEPFYRVDKARSRSANRSGLGLTLVKRMLDKMSIPFSLENSGTDVLFWMDLAAEK